MGGGSWEGGRTLTTSIQTKNSKKSGNKQIEHYVWNNSHVQLFLLFFFCLCVRASLCLVPFCGLRGGAMSRITLLRCFMFAVPLMSLPALADFAIEDFSRVDADVVRLVGDAALASGRTQAHTQHTHTHTHSTQHSTQHTAHSTQHTHTHTHTKRERERE